MPARTSPSFARLAPPPTPAEAVARKIAVWLIRLVVAAVVLMIAVHFWIEQASGWGKLGRFAAALGFGFVTVPAWMLAVAIGQCIADLRLRLVLHPFLTVALLLLFAVVVSSVAFGETGEMLWRDLGPFAALLTVATVADAAVGFLL